MTGQNPNIRAQAQAGDWGDHSDWRIDQNDLKKVKQIVNDMDPGAVDRAARHYDAIKGRADTTMGLIYRQAQRLAENWGGEDANAAMKQLQMAYKAIYEIYEKSGTTSHALTGFAETQRNWQRAVNGWGMDVGTSDTATAVVYLANPVTGAMTSLSKNEAADQMMAQLQQHTVESNNEFPTGIGADMPDAGVTKIEQPPPPRPIGPPTHPGSPPGTGTLSGGNRTGDFPEGGTDTFPDGYRTDTVLPGNDGQGTDLAGANQPGGAGGLGAGGLGGGLGGGAGAGNLGSPGAGGLGAGGFAGGVPATGLMGKGGAAGGGGMPMGAGGGRGGGGDEEECERTTWLAEDEDIWGGDDDTAPPVIG